MDQILGAMLRQKQPEAKDWGQEFETL